MAKTPSQQRIELYRRVFDSFSAPVTRFDCGQKCAPHNGGTPFCCSTDHAVPVLDRGEFALLRSRSDLWRPYRPKDSAGRKIVDELDDLSCAAQCKGAEHCERDNRSLSCRAFPFYPYVAPDNQIVGLSYAWFYETRCWVISHLELVTRDFVRECNAAYAAIIAEDPNEFEALRQRSISMRRLFTRWNRVIPLVGRDGEYLAVEPRTHRIRPARVDEFLRHGPYRDEAPLAAQA